jgi:hypothetical protein
MRAPSTRETTPTSRCESIRCGSCATHPGFNDEPPGPPGSGGFLVAGTPSATRHRCATSGFRRPRALAYRRAFRRRLTPGAQGTGAGQPPVALRTKAGRFSFSGARLPHAQHGEPSGSALLRWPKPPREPKTPPATVGRRAGAEARPAPNATAGRCIEEPSSSDSGGVRPSVSRQPAHRHGHGFRTRQSGTVSATDEADAENRDAMREDRHRGAAAKTRSSGTRVAEPVIAEEETACLRTERQPAEMSWLRVPWAPEATRHRCALLVLRRAREFAHRRACRTRYCAASVRVSMGTIPCGAPPGMAPGEARHSHQAGRRDARRWPRHPRTTNAPRHRRAASRSGGATSAERDGRPVHRRTQCPPKPRSVTGVRGRSGSPRCRCRRGWGAQGRLGPWPGAVSGIRGRSGPCTARCSLSLNLPLPLPLPLSLRSPTPQPAATPCRPATRSCRVWSPRPGSIRGATLRPGSGVR